MSTIIPPLSIPETLKDAVILSIQCSRKELQKGRVFNMASWSAKQKKTVCIAGAIIPYSGLDRFEFLSDPKWLRVIRSIDHVREGRIRHGHTIFYGIYNPNIIDVERGEYPPITSDWSPADVERLLQELEYDLCYRWYSTSVG